jgi:hypothetical protein
MVIEYIFSQGLMSALHRRLKIQKPPAKSRRRIAAATPHGRNTIVEELPAKIQYTVR